MKFELIAKKREAMLYCIKHEDMYEPVRSPVSNMFHTDWTVSPEGEPFQDLEFCDFDMGFAYCPPPPFDLDEYIERNGQPPAVIEVDFGAYAFDIERDEIIVEEML